MKIFLALIVTFCCAFVAQPLQAQATLAPPKAPVLVESSDSWQLPESHFVAAKMPMTVVHPRSFPAADGGDETVSWARHKKAYPGIEYRIPISIQGGAYPFYYEIIEAPAWLSIGGTVSEGNYGVLHGAAPGQTGGPQTVRVKITDQELTEKVVEFPLTVTNSTNDFIFVDINALTSGDGSIGSPLKYLGKEALGSGNASVPTYPGRAVYLRGGTHDIMPESYPDPDTNRGDIPYRNNIFPYVFLGYPGENAVIRFTNGRINTRSPGSDLFWGGLTLEESHVHKQSNFIEVWSMSRFTWFELNLRKINNRSGSSNQGGIHSNGSQGLRANWTFWGLHITEVAPGSSGLGSFYSNERMVFEDIRFGVGGSNNNYGIMLKGVNTWVSLRRVDGGFEGGWQRVIHNYNRQSAGPQRARFVEIAYSRVGQPEGQPRTSNAINILTADDRDSDTDPPSSIWVYRNTVIGGSIGTEGNPYGHFSFEGNVNFVDRTTHFQGSSNQYSLTIQNNLTGSYADRSVYLDENYQLKAPHRESLLGKVGHEIHH